MAERLIHGRPYSFWRELGMDPGSRWFGTPKDRTKNCAACELKITVDGREWCAFGAGKTLETRTGAKRCVLLDKQTGKPSIFWPNWVWKEE